VERQVTALSYIAKQDARRAVPDVAFGIRLACTMAYRVARSFGRGRGEEPAASQGFALSLKRSDPNTGVRRHLKAEGPGLKPGRGLPQSTAALPISSRSPLDGLQGLL